MAEEQFGKGVIGVATSFLGRYREFDVSVNRVVAPPGSVREWFMGVNIAFHFNNMIRKMLKGDYQWVWILGDDHVFQPNLLMRLLERNVDVVVPLCLRRNNPFFPVISGGEEQQYRSLKADGWDSIKGKSGLMELADLTTGNAGMLIKRHVAETMPGPWFENGKLNPETNGMDIWFCKKVRDHGFSLYLDLDNTIGHLTHVAVWPTRDENNAYSPDIRTP